MSPSKLQLQSGRQRGRWKSALLCALSFAAAAAMIPLRASADDGDPMTVASLKGTWQMTFMGITGCGFSTSVVTIVLDATGTGTATSRYHTAGCGDGIASTPVPFNVFTLNPDGSGTAGLSCGAACGWALVIQVEKNRQLFTAIDVDPMNPGNFVSAVAVRRTTPDD
jgi:hypothetical protein